MIFLIDFQWVWHNILALVFCYPFTLPSLFGSNNLIPKAHTLPICLHKVTAAFILSLFMVYVAFFVFDVHMYSWQILNTVVWQYNLIGKLVFVKVYRKQYWKLILMVIQHLEIYMNTVDIFSNSKDTPFVKKVTF